MDKKDFYWKKWLGAFLFGVALITVYKTFDNLSRIAEALYGFVGLLTPFTIGFILAFFLYPATLRLEAKLAGCKRPGILKRKKTISILTVYFGFIAIVLIAIGVILPRLSVSMADFLKRIPDYVNQLGQFAEKLTAEGGMLESFQLKESIESFNMKNLMQGLFMQDAWGYVEGVKGFTGALSSWFMGIVVCAYTLLERDSLFRIVRVFFGLFMKESTMDTVGAYVSRISTIFYKFFFGKMIDSLIIGGMAIVGFYFLGVPFPALLGITIMLFNMIPYFGPIIGAVPVVLITLLVKDIYAAVWTSLFILALQQFDGIWLGPKILGGSVGVTPFWVVFAIVVFGGLFGIWGMIFGVPMIAAIQMLAEDYLDDRKLNLTAAIKKKVESEGED